MLQNKFLSANRQFLLVSEFIILIVLVINCSIICSATPECEKTSSLKTVSLRNKLLCDYDSFTRPSETNTTIIMVTVIPKFVEFDDMSHTLAVHSWVSLTWSDPHFDWANDPSFSEIKTIHIASNEIWTPDISVYNSGLEAMSLPTTNCLVSARKLVTCLPAVKWVTRCTPDYQHWPFDRQNCTIRLGSWTHTKKELDYQLSPAGPDMIDFTENPEWKVLSVKAMKEMLMFKGWADMHPSITLNFIIERYSIHRKITVLAPAILLIVMTLIVLWLSPMSVERMVLAGINLISHLLCIMDINWQVPSTGANLPSILIFYQNSLIIGSLALFLTAFVRQLKEITLPAPIWLSSTTSIILESRIGQYFLLTTLDPKASAVLESIEEDNAGLVVQSNNLSTTKNNPSIISTWHHFATFIDRTAFFSIILTYVIMLIILIPKNDIIE